MAERLEIIKVGNELGVILPENALARLGVGPGDLLAVHEIPCGVMLCPQEPDPMPLVEKITRED